MNTPPAFEALRHYIEALDAGLRSTRRAEERQIYTSHLAHASLLWLALFSDDRDRLGDLVRSESRAFGYSYLQGELGLRAESLFQKFIESLSLPSSASQTK